VNESTPSALMLSLPRRLVAPPDGPGRPVSDLAAYGRTKPGGLSYGSRGNGSGRNLLGAMLSRAVDAPMVHVPYRGAGPASLDVSTGRLDFLFVSYSSVLPFYQSGKARILAVASPKRLTALPNVPTMAEAGLPDFNTPPWFGLVAPAGTPRPAIEKLAGAAQTAMHAPDAVDLLHKQGFEPKDLGPDQFASFIHREIARWSAVVHAAGMKS